MKKHPSIPLLVLAVAVAGLGLLVARTAAPRPVTPVVLQFRFYLVVAGLVLIGAVVAGLRRQPAREFARYRWPGRIPTRTVVWLFVVGAAFLALGVKVASLGPTCGNVRMRPGDQCLVNGSSASYSDMNSAPVRWIFVVISLLLVVYAIVQLIKRRPPTPQEVRDFQAAVVAARRHLITRHNQLAAQKIVSAEALPARLAKFEQDVKEERERATGGTRTSRKSRKPE